MWALTSEDIIQDIGICSMVQFWVLCIFPGHDVLIRKTITIDSHFLQIKSYED